MVHQEDVLFTNLLYTIAGHMFSFHDSIHSKSKRNLEKVAHFVCKLLSCTHEGRKSSTTMYGRLAECYTTALHKIGHEIGVQDYTTKCFAIIDPNHQRKSCRDTMKIETRQFWDPVIDLLQPGNSDSAICLDNCRWVRCTVPRLQSHQDQSFKVVQHPHCFE